MQVTNEFLQNLRQDYKSASLDEADVNDNPIHQFKEWFEHALSSHIYEPNVMTLATANAQGKPSARILLLKGVDENGFVFFSNYDSKKGNDLAENPQAALVFFWAELERQVRIEGIISKADEKTSVDYFHSRPKGSQISATISPQSKIIPDRKFLEEKVRLTEEKYEGAEIPKPLDWGGYILKPSYLEFWQGRASRLHDRISYNLFEGIWVKKRLAP